jgi:hypothetical protein
MFAHLKWWFVLAGLLILTAVIAIERLVWKLVRKMFAYRSAQLNLNRDR